MRRIHVGIAGVFIVAALLVWICWDSDAPKSVGQSQDKGLPQKQAGQPEHSATATVTPSSTPQTADDKPVDEVIRDPLVVNIDEEWVDAKLRVPALKWRRELVKSIRNESVPEMIDHLASIDDMHFAVTSLGSQMVGNWPDSRVQMLVVSRLSRVRRLLEIGKDNPQDVVPSLKDAFQKAMTDWPDARREQAKLWTNPNNPDKPGILILPRNGGRQEMFRMQSIAATYLLAELGDHDALPMLAKSFQLSLDPKYLWGVPSGITLYAMHRLMLTYPEDMLDPEGVRLRQEYLESAGKVLPPVREIQVTKSTAVYQESDPRIAIMDPKRVVLAGEPRMTMPIYPWTFVDGTSISEPFGETSPKALSLFEQIKRFVEHTYAQP